jgi:hypothetical protein
MSANPKTDAALDAELFARAGAIVEVLVLKRGRWYAEQVAGFPFFVSSLDFAVALTV